MRRAIVVREHLKGDVKALSSMCMRAPHTRSLPNLTVPWSTNGATRLHRRRARGRERRDTAANGKGDRGIHKGRPRRPGPGLEDLPNTNPPWISTGGAWGVFWELAAWPCCRNEAFRCSGRRARRTWENYTVLHERYLGLPSENSTVTAQQCPDSARIFGPNLLILMTDDNVYAQTLHAARRGMFKRQDSTSSPFSAPIVSDRLALRGKPGRRVFRCGTETKGK